MIRSFMVATSVGIALLATTVGSADEVFPVVHNEPITVRIVSARDGRPVAHLHLLMAAGYDENDIRRGLWQQETLTDDQGRALLSKALANLPFLQVWVAKKHLCEAHTATSNFSVELIRRDGASTPNRCGIATVADAPGTFNVFVKTRRIKVKKPRPSASCWWLPSPHIPKTKPVAGLKPAAEIGQTEGGK